MWSGRPRSGMVQALQIQSAAGRNCSPCKSTLCEPSDILASSSKRRKVSFVASSSKLALVHRPSQSQQIQLPPPPRP
eukprot:CAMPEP_0195036956 /NCGR_PEP_ID=MMETSP0326_2-20130528/73793_1 /TAXON_ID=2866 ORGANISM="Crypthecodinium cohnii, Strain Seligo" /NCGR_SAMPLE_ID=MMETSP0326_2 /ASSEMBLY_ACC=CAM_ASM_000348 /LENGTH=76 /DNA_ID=CAMNT_0040062753 /DNA_START=284 /DNA_END=510 /DNA_ORIENTATION=+